MRFVSFTLLLMWIGLSYPCVVLADESNSGHFQLSDTEKAWLTAHPKIRVGAMDTWAPLDFVDIHGKPAGIGADYLNALNKRLNGALVLVPGKWDDLYLKVKNKQLDALMDITSKKDRQPFFNFTKPYLTIPHVIVARKDSPGYANENSLEGKTIALESGFGNVDYFREKFPKINIKEYRDTRRALAAVANGEVDAYAGNRTVALYIMEREVMTNLKVQGRLHKEGSVLSIGTRKDWVMLANILNHALDDIKTEEISKIHSRWLGEHSSYKYVKLSMYEQQWLRDHPRISIAFDGKYPPYSFINDKGEFEGIAVDIARELAVRIGVQLDIYPEGNWQQIYSAAQGGDIDVIATLVKRGNREEWFSFTRPYITLSQYIITQKQDLPEVNSKVWLEGRRVALIKGYSTTDMILEEVPNTRPVYVNDLQQALEYVSSGKADATVGDIGMTYHFIARGGLSNLGYALPFSRSQSKQRFGVRKDWHELATILDKALESLTYGQLMGIYARWNLPEKVKPETGFLSVMQQLTDKEKEWLDSHPTIRLASDIAWPPFETIDTKGNYSGIAADYIDLVEQRLGVKFVVSPRKPWNEIVDMMKHKELDVFSCAMATKERNKYANFTSPYISHPMVIVTRDNIGFIDGLSGLEDKTVAMEQSYASFEMISDDHPEIHVLPFKDSTSAMMAVSDGEAFAYIGNIATLSSVVHDKGITNIKMSGQVPYSFDLAMGVRNDWPELTSILEKTLDSISLEEKNNILQKWIAFDVKSSFNYKFAVELFMLAMLIILGFTYWNRKLSREVNQRKLAEKELISYQTMLEQKSLELASALSEARRANSAKSEFLSNMSHELRTPLNAILGFAELLKIDSQLNNNQKESADEILHAGRHLLEIINEILDLAKVESGHMDLYIETVDVFSVAQECIAITQPLAMRRQITIQNLITPGTLVKGDRMRLKQAVLNLVSNAIKYNKDEGSVILSAEDTGHETIRIQVKDTGIGIPEEDREQLFEPFMRLQAEKTDIEGTGIGLVLTRRVVELMDGLIGVESELGRGSTFWIELPSDSYLIESSESLENI